MTEKSTGGSQPYELVSWKVDTPLVAGGRKYWFVGQSSLLSSDRERTIQVRKGPDGLYCPYHPQQRLEQSTDSGEDRKKFLECLDKKCNFNVYIGT